MDSKTREQLRAWLRFYDEIGLSPFYRERQAKKEVAELTPIEKTPETPSAAPRPMTTPVLAFRSGGRPQALSLFEETPRIVNDTLERIREEIGDCRRCRLWEHRKTIVYGVGNPRAELVFVGEAPGADEDEQGIPFVGRAGQLLTRMLAAIDLSRDDVYICNVIKCRPPGNRSPERDEIETCSQFLFRQLDVIQPKIICCLGGVALNTLLGTNQPISKVRGQFLDYHGVALIATFHPAYLLRNPNAKREVWEDLKKIREYLRKAR